MNSYASQEAGTFQRTLSRIIPAIVILGFLAYLAFLVTLRSDSLAFYQIGIAVGMLVYLLTFMDMILGIAVLITCIGLSPEVSVAGFSNLRLEDFIIPGLVLAWLTRAAQDREEFAPIHVKGPLLLYFCAILLSTCVGLLGRTTEPVLTLSILAKYVEYFAIYLLILNSVKKEGEFQALVVLAVLVALFSAWTGSINYAGVGGGATPLRLQGPLGETANIFGGYLILNLAILAGIFLHARTGPMRLLAGAGMAALFLALLYTFSRTSYVALGVALLAFGVFKERRVILILLLIAVVLPLAAPAGVAARMATIAGIASEQGPPSYASRVNAWEVAFNKVAADAPVIGFGLGSVDLGNIDSEYFRALSDTGFLGLALFAWLLCRLFRVTNQGYDALPPRGFHKGYAAGYWIALAAMIVHASAATSFTSIRTMETFILFTALFVCQINRREEWNLVAPAPPAVPAQKPAHATPFV